MRDLFAYRGWPWWCGTAWLILGCIAFVTNARFLMAPAVLLLAVGVAGLAMEGLRTGTVEVQAMVLVAVLAGLPEENLVPQATRR